jgi:hypothetical protein
MANRTCLCAEGWYEDKAGKRRKVKAPHDCEYIAHRNSLIPKAEAMANQATKAERGTILYSATWSRAFFAAMNGLMTDATR